MKPFLLLLFMGLVCYWPTTTFAQKKYDPSRYIYHPSTSALTFNVGAGKVRSFTTVSAWFEREQFVGSDFRFSFVLNVGAYYGGTTQAISKDGYRTKIAAGLVSPGCRFHPLTGKSKGDIALAVQLPLGWGYRKDELGMTALLDKYGNRGLISSVEGQLAMSLRNLRGRIAGVFATAGYTFRQPSPTRRYVSDADTYFLIGLRFGAEWN